MGAVDLGAGSGRRVKTSGPKKPKRVGFSLDMTPLVDIAFLLLTFFMFATTMAQPTMMEMRIPPDIDTDTKAEEENVLDLYINEDGGLFYREGRDTTFNELEPSDVRDFSVRRNAAKGNDLILSLKLHPEANFEDMVTVLDQLNKAETILTERYLAERNVERKRKFSIQRLDSLEQMKLDEL